MDSEKNLENPRLRANVLSKLFFCWLVPIFWRGRKGDLEQKDIYNVLPKDSSRTLGDKLENNWTIESENAQKKKRKPNFQTAILRTMKWPLLKLGLVIFILIIVVKTAQPIALGMLIGHFSLNSKSSTNDAYFYAFGVVLMTVLESFIMHHVSHAARELGMQLRIACSSLIFRKIMKLSCASSVKASDGLAINLLSNDVVRFEQVFTCSHYIWITPVQVIVVSYFIYQNVGVASLAGVFFMILQTIPFQAYCGRKIHALRQKAAIRTDRRVQMMNEIIDGIRVIKMYTWEPVFEKLVTVARKYELNVIASSNYLKGTIWASFSYAQRTAVFVTIMFYVLDGNDMTAEKVFTIFQFFTVLQWSMTGLFPRGVQFYLEAKVSVHRIQEFLMLDETEAGCKFLKNCSDQSSISIEKVTASWTEEGETETLSEIHVTLPRKNLCAVVGPVGGGKSSFLKLILGELSPKIGEVSVHGNVSYASQESWLFPGSVKNNILFGQPFDEDKYNRVIKTCCLLEDFEQLPYGDRTLVGEKGSSLSGGQCARVNLARAVYRDVDIYLLDDPLSAVDTSVGKRLFEDCINGYLKDKTRILATHQMQFLKRADTILLLDKGKLKYQGNFENFQKQSEDFQLEDESDSDQEHSEFEEIFQEDEDGPLHVPPSNENEIREEPKETEELIVKGNIQNSLYWNYFQANGSYLLLIFIVFLYLITQSLISGSDFWLAYWVGREEEKLIPSNGGKIKFSNESSNVVSLPEPEKNHLNDTISTDEKKLYYLIGYTPLYIYAGLVFGSAILSTLRNILMYTVCKRSSFNIHNMMINCILKTPMHFFDVNPSGRILNRFSKDLGAVDEILSLALVDSLQALSTFIGVTVQIIIINWWLMLPMCIMVFLQLKINKVYLATGQNLKRIEGNAKSPVLTHANSSLSGLLTIRSCKAEKMICKEFDNHQDVHTATFSLTLSIMMAFGFWIDLISVTFVSILTFSFIVLDQKLTGDTIGLAITQALFICIILQYSLRMIAEVVAQMISVERLFQFTKLEQEGPFESGPGRGPRKGWPDRGEIKFENLYLKYTGTSEPVLKNLNFRIDSGMKVGIVGRTGAGKSSLISALFRLAKNDGKLYIDELDINGIGLRELRSQISIIPQDPILFSASLRDNLDPLKKCEDSVLWSALKDVELSQLFDSLDKPIDKSSFSVGQRQLFCLARAIVKKSKILVLDEATANVDPGTDALIQKTIRINFKDCTVLTIAHRLNTVIDSDKVLVMNYGEVAEYDHPHTLMKNNFIFTQMVQQTGPTMAEYLKNLAEQIYSETRSDNMVS